MAKYPSAEWAPVAWMNALSHHRKTQLTVHITAGEGDPRTIASWKTGKAGANFVIFRDGRTMQLADSACKSAADYGATHTISVECVGLNGPLTPAQVQSLIRLAQDAHRLDGVPLRLAATSSDAGIGWHRLGVDGAFPSGRMGGRLQRTPLGVKTSSARGKACPTDAVINQIYDTILPALTAGQSGTASTGGGFLMALSDQKQQEMYDRIMGALPGKENGRAAYPRVLDTGDGKHILDSIALARNQIAEFTRAVVNAGVAEIVAALPNVDPAKVEEALTKAATDAFAGFELTLATKEK